MSVLSVLCSDESVFQDLRVQVKISPVIRLTLDPETRRIANIHERAVGVAFMHPMEIHEGVDMSQLTVAEQAALKNGAFAMFSFYAFNSNLCTQNFCPKKNYPPGT